MVSPSGRPPGRSVGHRFVSAGGCRVDRRERSIAGRCRIALLAVLLLTVWSAQAAVLAGSAESAPGEPAQPVVYLPVALRSTEGPPPSPVSDLDRFFGLGVVHRVDIDVGEAGVAALLERPREYVAGAVRIDEAAYDHVGVRLKGGAGSFIPLDGDYPPVSGDGNCRPGKSAFIVDFNRYVKGQSLYGLEKLTLNNLVQDPSGIHELVGYALFRAAGVPASRTGFAMVYFNGLLKGLYALVEPPDNDEFLRQWFGDDSGNLYEGEYGADLRPESVEAFDQDHGRDRSRRDLRELSAALEAIPDGEDPLGVIDRYIDVDRYLTFAATEMFLGHWDGYAWSANNYMIYHDLAGDRWVFMPWGIDQLFEDPMGRFAGVMRQPGPAWEPGPGGRIQTLCYRSHACRQRLFDAFGALLARVESAGLVRTAQDATRLVEPYLLAEAQEFGDPAITIRAGRHVPDYIQDHGRALASWLPCLADEPVDHDGDGFDGCRADCRDDDPHIHPGAVEECNFRDDDCNGRIDDPERCPRCLELDGPAGRTYALCIDAESWPMAGQRCAEQGGLLASVHDEPTFRLLADTLLERMEVPESWIGLNDRAVEGRFEWTDGSALDFTPWAPDAPRPGGDEADCVLMHERDWIDTECDRPAPYVCQH